MILSESRTADWIRDAAAKNGAADIGLVEKTIRAFSLLEALVNADCPLVFKGGSSLLLHFSEGLGRRLSVDVDIMCPPGVKTPERFNADMVEDLASVSVQPVLHQRLNRLKRTDIESFFYWQKASELLK